MLPERIRTDRLVLRPWSLHDASDLLSYASNEQWARYLPVPHPYSESDAARFIARQILVDSSQTATWAIEFKGHATGGIDLRFIDDHRIGEIGYSLARTLRGRGLALEATRAVIGVAFDVYPRLARVRAMVHADNTRSARVLEKLGMIREGVLRQNRLHRNEFMDEVWYGVLRAEWGAAGEGNHAASPA